MDHKRSPVQSSLEVTFLLKLLCSSLRRQHENDNITVINLVYLGENFTRSMLVVLFDVIDQRTEMNETDVAFMFI